MAEQQRDRILTCACELYLHGGLEGFSMRKLAQKLGVTAPSLYRHFDSREQVLLEVVREAYQRLAQQLHRALQGRTPAERFELAGDAYLEFALSNPRLYDVLYAPPDQMGWERLPEEVEVQVCAVGQFWTDRVRECMEAGILRKADTGDVGMTLWAHAHGLITLYLRGVLRTDEKGFREIYRGSARRVLAGLGTPEYAARLLRLDNGGQVESPAPAVAYEPGYPQYRTGT
jgi:AcrR family transcriptional regulator